MEKSAGAVIFTDTASGPEYLLVQYRHGRWDFPRGHIEPGEEEMETAKREILEETGLSELEYLPNFRVVTDWIFGQGKSKSSRKKQVVYFLARSQTKKVALNHENFQYRWLGYAAAVRLPMFPHVGEVLEKAAGYLKK